MFLYKILVMFAVVRRIKASHIQRKAHCSQPYDVAFERSVFFQRFEIPHEHEF